MDMLIQPKSGRVFAYLTTVLSPKMSLNTRESVDHAHKTVVDLFSEGRDALCVCLDCGKTWEEGASYDEGFPRDCTPRRRLR